MINAHPIVAVFYKKVKNQKNLNVDTDIQSLLQHLLHKISNYNPFKTKDVHMIK